MALSASVAPETPTRHTRRSARLRARETSWKVSSLPRVRACGRYDTGDGVTILAAGSAVDGTRVAGLAGVQSCGSVWACAVCAQKIQARRQTEVATALAVARLRGWEVLFLTLTMRHDRDHRLKRLWDHLQVAWGAVTTGRGQRAWKRDKLDYGIAGYLRLVEVTHGQNGWHVHAHILLFCDPARAEVLQELGRDSAGGFSDGDVTALGTRMFLRWRSALNHRGIRPSLRRGVDIQRVRADEDMAGYFAKQMYSRKGEGSTAHDVTGSHGKDAKNGNRTPFGILAGLVDLASTGEISDASERDLDLWHTFEQASKGRRQLLWARGLRDDLLAGLDDLDDQAVVDEAPGGDEVATVPRPVWRAIAERGLIGDLLGLAESDDDGSAVRAFLAAGLEFYKPDKPRLQR